MFSLTDYSYHLPQEQIAQQPLAQREQSKLLCMDRESGSLSHHKFCEICEMLLPSDVLVINNTEVIPGRLFGKKDTGGKAEVLILDYGNGTKNSGICKCLIKASKGLRKGARLFFQDGTIAEITDVNDGIHTVKFSCNGGDFEDMLYRIGKTPLPPYILRNQEVVSPCDDRTTYQTVYASQKGAIAAPTAGFHFSASLLEKIKSKGVKVVAITLHVGYGTFLPVRVSDIREHRMHSERYSVSEQTVEVINRAKTEGSRVIAVGTTCVRTLEYASDAKGNVRVGAGECDLFIYPGYSFRVADAMITNFHLPESTLLMLVSAFAGREKILNAYKEAIEKNYRFYSYGDAMFIS